MEQIDVSGILPNCWTKVVKEAPALKEVEVCKNYLKEFYEPCKAVKTAQRNGYSYRLKHQAEKWGKTYVTNGALIQAGLELGLKYARSEGNSPNVHFYVKPRW